jgi:hypothetical protein
MEQYPSPSFMKSIILINHLTRMNHPNYCIAGIDIDRKTHVRPELKNGRITDIYLGKKRGPFSIGSIVEIPDLDLNPEKPQSENARFRAQRVRVIQKLSSSEFWNYLNEYAKKNLEEIFTELNYEEKNNGRFGTFVKPREGNVSLGILKTKNLMLYSSPTGGASIKLRAVLRENNRQIDLSVTDYRLYEDDFITPKFELFKKYEELAIKEDLMICVGLTKLYNEKYHWLQVNNIYFKNGPIESG